MNDRYLFRAKRKYNGEWVEGCLIIDESRENEYKYRIKPIENSQIHAYPVDASTITILLLVSVKIQSKELLMNSRQ